MRSIFSGNRKIWSKVLRSYLIMLVVPIALSLFLYAYLNNSMIDDTTKRNEALMKQVVSSVDDTLDDIVNSIADLSTNTHLRPHLLPPTKPPNYGDVGQIKSVIAIMGRMHTTNQLVDAYALYLDDAQIFILNDDAYMRTEQMYETLLKHDDLSFLQWRDQLLLRKGRLTFLPVAPISLNGDVKDRLVVFQSILNYPNQNHLGQVLAYISVDQLSAMFQPLLELGVYNVMVSGPEQGYIATIGNQDLPTDWYEEGQILTHAGQRLLMVKMQSKKYPIIYTMAIPMHVIDRYASFLQKALLIYGVVLLIMGVSIALFVSYKNSLPVLRLTEHLTQSGYLISGKDTMPKIYSAVKTILNNKNNLEEQHEQMRTNLRSAAFFRLIHGNYIDEKEIKVLQEILSLPDDTMYNGAMMEVINLPDEDDTLFEYAYVALQETIGDGSIPIGFCAPMPRRHVAVLFLHGEENREACPYFEHVQELLQVNYGLAVRFALGNTVERLTDISISFAEAQRLLRFTNPKGNTLILQKNSPKDLAQHQYTGQQQTALVSYTVSGQYDEVSKLLQEIYQDNFKTQKIGLFHTQLLLSEMTNTMLSILHKHSDIMPDKGTLPVLEDGVMRIPDSESPETAFEAMQDSYQQICQLFEHAKKSHNTELIEEILEYLQRNYSSQELYLTSVAEEFSMNERYLSSFFREQTGETFVAYLTKLRVQAANILLVETDLRIADIAQMVGYIGPDTFRKAYKRTTGHNPSYAKQKYRKGIKHETK